jgi:hypothetical protein
MPVKILHGIRTGCRAVTATDAPVINLSHQSFLVLIGGKYGTNLCARGMVTVHAGTGKESGLDMGILSLDVGNELDPVNGSAPGGLLRADDANVILRMTGHHTGLASRAPV